MKFKYLLGIFCIIALILPGAFAQDLMNLHGKAYDANLLMSTGDVRVQIFDAPAAGNLIYDSLTDFNGAIDNGLFDVLLGSGIPLDLNFGQNYYYGLKINGNDINFGTSNREIFQSAHGDLNIYPISQLINDKGYLTNSALTPYLLQTDANTFYPLKPDVNIWINQKLVPYLLQTDANSFYPLKSDVNIWINQKLVPYLLASDANGFFYTKNYIDTNIVPYIGATKDVNLNNKNLTDVNYLSVNGNAYIDGNLLFRVPHGTFLSTKTQTVAVTNTAYFMDFNTVAENYGIIREGDTNFRFQRAGSYEAIISVIVQSSNPAHRINIWFAENGVAVPNSNTLYDFKSTNSNTVISVPFTFDINTTDVLSVMYSGDFIGITLPFVPAAPPAPATPSSIITIKWISDTHSN